MGRAATRQAITSYIESLNLPFVGTVYPSRPMIVPEDAYDVSMAGQVVTSPNGSSAIVVVHLPEDKRSRDPLTGYGFVEDKDVHAVILETWMGNVSGNAITAQADHDLFIDSLVMGLRGDPNLGNPQVIWAAGEFEKGVQVSQGEPYQQPDGTAMIFPCHIHFDAWEWLSGPAGTV